MSPHTLKVVSNDDNDYVAVYFDNELVYQHDLNPEALYRLAKHLGWKIEHEVISDEEYENRFA